MWGLFTFSFVISYLKHFSNKIISLLIMEAVFLYMLFHMTITSHLFQGLNFYVIMAFMVLDSMLGITLLISCSRNTSSLSSIYYSF